MERPAARTRGAHGGATVTATRQSSPYVLGIDTALDKTGVGRIELVDGECHGSTRLITTSTPPDHSIPERCRRIDHIGGEAASLWSWLAPPELVLIEAPALDAQWGDAHTRAGVWFAVVRPLWRAGVPVAEVAPMTLKRWAVGRGGSKQNPVEKRHVVEAMHRMWPGVPATFYPQRHHECEGLAMAQMCAQHLGWPVPVRRHQGEPLAVVKWPEPAA